MVIKINYTSSDVYVSTSVSPVYVVVNYSGVSTGGGVWGQITGTLSNQTDLQNALDAKFDDPTGTTSQYLRGDGSLATFPTIPSGTVTSVGLTMPSAFSVANSPVTSSGTLAVTGAGTSSQYVRGDGQLANFPSNGGGGSSVNYYLNGSVNQGTFGGDTYYEMSKTPVLGAGTNFTRTNAQGNGYIASFITDAGDPSLLNIPGGNWNLEFYFQSSASGGSPQFYGEVYKVDASNNFTLVASGSTNPEGITNGTTVDQYFTSIPVPQTSLLVTDRLAVRIYVITSGRTITLHTEDGNLCEVLTTFSTGLNALNGLTSQVQYFATGTSGTDFAISSATDTHTFNLPTASAINRGALSSADWSTFSGKVGGTGAAGQVAYWNGTNSQTGSNNLFWDAANARLGIGTNAPAYKMHLFNSGSVTSAIEASGAGASSILRFISPSQYWTITNDGTSAHLTFNRGGTDLIRFSNVGNLMLQNGGTFTDGGQRLQVQGDAFIKGSGATSGTIGLQVQNSAGTNLLRVQNNGIVSIGDGPADTLSNNGDVILKLNSSFQYWTIQNRQNAGLEFLNQNYAGGYSFFTLTDARNTSSSQTNALFQRFFTQNSVNNRTFINVELRGDINQTGGATGISRGLYVNHTITAAADWRSIEWSNNSGWGLYGAGTANNYLGGNLVIGQTTSSLQSGGTGVTIYGASASEIKFLNSTTGTSATDGTALVATGNTFTINNREVGDLTFGTSNAERMRLTAAGRLLLGTTTESTFLLDVNGTARVSGDATFSTNVGIGISPLSRLHISGAGDQSIILQSTSTGTTTSSYIKYIRATTGSARTWWTGVGIQGGGDDSYSFYDQTAGSERLRITSGGNLLVGTTTDAGFKLDVNGTARVSGNLTVDTNTLFVDATNDRVGIGTSSPALPLTIFNSNAATLYQTAGTGTGGGNGFYVGHTGNVSYVFNYNAFPIEFGTSNIARMTLTAGGNLLVGTTSSAGYLFQANGSIASTNSTAGQLYSVSGTRSIGIQSFAGDWNYLRSNGANLVFGTQDANTLYIRTSDVDRLTITSTGAATFSSSVTATQFRLSALNTAPANASATGTLGEIRIDADYIYVCTATNTWKRTAIATW